MSADDILKEISEKEVGFVDLRFTDTIGKEQHVTYPAAAVNSGMFEDGAMFDGSSIAGWKGINESDMVLMPDIATAVLDPFTDETTMNITCDVLEPTTMEGYSRDPRSIAHRAEAYMYRRHGVLWAGAGVFCLRQRALGRSYGKFVLCDRLGRGELVEW
jgi:glutamine synthetase